MMKSEPARRTARDWTFIALRWIAALIVLGALLHFLPLKTVRSAIARVPPIYFFAALLGYLLAHAVGVLKWRMVVNAAGAQLDFATSLQCYGGGLFGTVEVLRALQRRSQRQTSFCCMAGFTPKMRAALWCRLLPFTVIRLLPSAQMRVSQREPGLARASSISAAAWCCPVSSTHTRILPRAHRIRTSAASGTG